VRGDRISPDNDFLKEVIISVRLWAKDKIRGFAFCFAVHSVEGGKVFLD